MNVVIDSVAKDQGFFIGEELFDQAIVFWELRAAEIIIKAIRPLEAWFPFVDAKIESVLSVPVAWRHRDGILPKDFEMLIGEDVAEFAHLGPSPKAIGAFDVKE